MNSVSEKIDERILRLLGLEDVFDLDYDTYLTELKDAMVRGSFGKNKIPDEELALLANERKRIRGKKGRFKPKKEKLTANKVATSKLLKPSIKSSPKLIKPKNILGKDSLELSGGVGREIQDITQRLDQILKGLIEQNKIEKKSAEDKRKEREDNKRERKESRLEGALKPIVNAAKKVLAPVQGILDKIVRFIVFTVLGRAFKLFMDWSSDPKNKQKLETIGRFLKDWWPTLLGAWFLFANPLGRFIRTVVGTVLKLTFKIGKFAIPRLLSFIKANPLVAAGAVTGIAAGAGYMMEQNRMNEISKREGAEPEKRGQGSWWNEIGKSFNPGQLGMGGVSPLGLARGGSVFSGIVGPNSGVTVGGAGPDTQFFPVEGGGGAVLQKGESVLQVGARERMIQEAGIDPLAYNVGSNANKPRSVGGNVFARQFGGVISAFNNGGSIGNNPNFWTLAAIAGKEAGHVPQGQADVAQSIYNRAMSGIYPGGKDIRKIITAPGQYQPTFKNPNAWNQIRDKSTAANVVGDSKLVDMAAKSLMNPTLQRNSANYIGSRTDFMGESQKKNMKPQKGDITRGSRHNFFGWFTNNGYKMRLPKPAPVPGFISSAKQQEPQEKQQQPNMFERFTSGVSSMFGMQKKQKGGAINIGENSGSDYGPDGNRLEGADRQYFPGYFVQPGESKYVFTKTATERGAVDLANLIQAKLDPNSAAAMKGKYTLSPPKRGRGGIQVLPPIKKSGGTVSRPGQAPETVVPSFSIVARAGYETRMKIASTCGLT